MTFRPLEPARQYTRKAYYCGCEEAYECCEHCDHWGCHTCQEDEGSWEEVAQEEEGSCHCAHGYCETCHYCTSEDDE